MTHHRLAILPGLTHYDIKHEPSPITCREPVPRRRVAVVRSISAAAGFPDQPNPPTPDEVGVAVVPRVLLDDVDQDATQVG